jgi:hypothetical protein
VIRLPAWVIAVLTPIVTFSVGLLLAEDISAYWRPGLAQCILAVFALCGAAESLSRKAAKKRDVDVRFTEAAVYAAAADRDQSHQSTLDDLAAKNAELEAAVTEMKKHQPNRPAKKTGTKQPASKREPAKTADRARQKDG